MNAAINVTKRDGRLVPLNYEAINRVLAWACEDLSGVSSSLIAVKANIQFYDKIKTSEIHETLIKSAGDLISAENPNYQYVAGRLVNFDLRKSVWNGVEPPDLLSHIKSNVERGFYDPEILEKYTAEEIKELGDHVNHDLDLHLTYAAMEQFRGKYLVRDRVKKQFLETPQQLYMMIAATLFMSYPRETRLHWVKEYYDAISGHYVSLPTPIMAGVRTPLRQFSSCVTVETGDSLESINATTNAIVNYVSQRAGIGIGAGAIRSLGSPIRNGDALHTGVIPFYKLFQAAVLSCSQGGVRSGAATLYYPIWQLEIEDLLVLKNNKGTEDTRVRHIDYGVQFSRLFYKRLMEGGNITLFSPSEVPGLYDAFFADQEEFERLYTRAERNTKLRKKVVKALDLFSSFMTERKETGRIYLMNVDHVNNHSAYDPKVAPVKMSNLCLVGDTKVTLRCTDSEGCPHFIGDSLETVGALMMEHEDLSVWSRDLSTGKDEFRKIKAFSKTRSYAKVIKVSDKFGSSIKCTPDHLIYSRSQGKYVEAWKLPPEEAKIEDVEELYHVYDIEVEGNHNFYADGGILVHNCTEISLPTTPMGDDESLIGLCTLSAINWGKIKHPDDFQKWCELAVRGLDELLSYQNYPVEAGERHTKLYRPLGVGIINFAYWMAKNDLKYDGIDREGLQKIHEFVEAWSFYLVDASVTLAQEKGRIPGYENTKWSKGLLPIDTYKRDLDQVVDPDYKMNWDSLRKRMAIHGIRNSNLTAIMPSETSSLISNATNGIEPPRNLVSVKQSKDGVFKQVVPEIRRLKNKYDLLWDQRSPEGYLKICAVIQKFVDQNLSINTSYNPKHYPEDQIPMSEMLRHLLMHYKYGGHTLYYFQTNDGAGEQELDQKPDDSHDECEACVL